MSMFYLWKMGDAPEPPAGFILHDAYGMEPWVVLQRTKGAPVPNDLIPMPLAHRALDAILNRVDDGSWVKWLGGKMPVPQGTLVDVEHRDGTCHFQQFAGSEHGAACEWEHGDGGEYLTDPADIIAYRRSPRRGRY